MSQSIITLDQEQTKQRRAEELARQLIELPQRAQDKIAGAIMMAQMETVEKAG